VVFPGRAPLTWHILINSDPPPPLYHLLPTPPPSKPPNHLLIPPPLRRHTPLPPPIRHVPLLCRRTIPTHLSPITSHPLVIHSLPSTSPPYTRYPFITLHLIPEIPVGQSMRATMTVSRLTHHPLPNGHPFILLIPFFTIVALFTIQTQPHHTFFTILFNQHPPLTPGKHN
jgi:hypothetical protein